MYFSDIIEREIYSGKWKLPTEAPHRKYLPCPRHVVLNYCRVVTGFMYPGFPQTNAFYYAYHFFVNVVPICFRNPV
jgi:hypothetical protein